MFACCWLLVLFGICLLLLFVSYLFVDLWPFRAETVCTIGIVQLAARKLESCDCLVTLLCWRDDVVAALSQKLTSDASRWRTGKGGLSRTRSTLVRRYPCGANPAGARCIASTTGRPQARLISGPAHAKWLAILRPGGLFPSCLVHAQARASAAVIPWAGRTAF